ncbi:MAG: hypothetical protein R3335_02025 [Anaerolineales bacterium]|nr:hypothetical protein [Anaerolineales bacterium]
MRSIELSLAFVGALLCAGGALLFGMSVVSPETAIWPLPGLVLLGITVFGLLGLTAAAREADRAHAIWGYIPWTITGALAALVVLGRLTIGPFLILPVVCFLAAGILSRERWETRLPLALALTALAAIAQSVALLLPLFLAGMG